MTSVKASAIFRVMCQVVLAMLLLLLVLLDLLFKDLLERDEVFCVETACVIVCVSVQTVRRYCRLLTIL